MQQEALIEPTVQLRYFLDDAKGNGPYWRYDWWDHAVTFVGGSAPDRTKRFNSMSGVLAALLADSARTLTAGTTEEHEAES